MDAFLQNLQKRLLPGVLARGRSIASSGGVALDRRTDDEIIFRVRGTQAGASLQVSLWPIDEDYHCECEEEADPCFHVAAALFALRSGIEPSQGVAYSLTSTPAMSGRVQLSVVRTGEGALLTELDLQIERWLNPALGETPWPKLLEALREAGGLNWEGRTLRLGPPRPEYSWVITEEEGARGKGYRIRVEMDSTITKRWEPGLILRGDEISVSVETEKLSEEVKTQGVFVPIHEEQRLIRESIPALEKKRPVEIRSPRLRSLREQPVNVREGIEFWIEEEHSADSRGLFRVSARIEAPNAEAERRWVRRLQLEFQMAPGQWRRFRGIEALEWVESLQLAIRTQPAGLSVSGPALGALRREAPLELQIQWGVVRKEELSHELEIEIHSSSPGLTGESVLRAWQEGSSQIRVPGGGFAPLPLGWLERHGPTLSKLLAFKGQGRIPRYLEAEIRELQGAHSDPLRAPFTDSATPWSPPPDLRAELRSYQGDGVAWLHQMKGAGVGAVLADDMGLGKTLQALCIAERGTLIVCPTSVIESWRTQIERFRPGLSVSVYSGPGRRLEPACDITLTSYAVLRLDAEVLGSIKWQSVFLDEAQIIKNPDSQVTRAAKKIEGRFKLALSGTPIENRLEDLWSILDLLNPGILGTRSEFREHWAGPIEKGEAQVAQRLRARTAPFILRRLKKEVARELPPKTESVLHCDLTEHERGLYATLQAATRKEVLELLDQGGGSFGVLEQLLRLRQAACHPALVSGEQPKEQEARGSSKTDAWMESLEASVASGHRALVFSQWTSFLDLLEPLLRDKGIGFLRLDGSTQDRGSIVEQFQSPSGPPVLLLSLKAGGVGLTLTAADHVYLMDSWWNPAVEDQASDRAYRIGQDKPVVVYRMVARDTVEEKILALQVRKRALADHAVGMGAQLSRQELLALLN